MPIARPDHSPATAPGHPAESGFTHQHEHEPEHDRARARDETPDQPGAGGAVLAFPRGDTTPDTRSDPAPAATRPRAALEVWTSEAAATAKDVWGGSVWHARPASLRDREARVRRAEWSGGIPALAIPGRLYGYAIALPVTVLLRAVEQTVSRPARLLTLALAVAIPLLLA